MFCGRFRAAAFGHWLTSPVSGGGAPLNWVPEPVVATVVADEVDELDEMDDAELDRWRPFRPNIALTSSVMGVAGWPPLLPHAGLLRGKEGGLATAVMGGCRGGEDTWLGWRSRGGYSLLT